MILRSCSISLLLSGYSVHYRFRRRILTPSPMLRRCISTNRGWLSYHDILTHFISSAEEIILSHRRRRISTCKRCQGTQSGGSKFFTPRWEHYWVSACTSYPWPRGCLHGQIQTNIGCSQGDVSRRRNEGGFTKWEVLHPSHLLHLPSTTKWLLLYPPTLFAVS